VTSVPLDIAGPVRAEVFVLFHDGGEIRVTGPCGVAPWHIETHNDAHPLDLVRVMAERVMGSVRLVHSTSWRWATDAVVLTFVVVVGAETVGSMASGPVDRSDLARSTAMAAPSAIGWTQVLEHGLRHLAWLDREDDHVRDALDAGWRTALTTYVPAPFQQLDPIEET
jgi:hypothetical protein